ncbi:conserved exported hypothetical protein [Mesorhizobium metallidurans STM 2683]|uniref:Helicase n=1 Tax=Mesorhizobium metallidurans STM 2683 TaxID=1297569 RepID=M5EWY0_9HYPH|nr:conserved exported hypothetical protein [Mesorhizobium metallidurans STM 2683]
MKRYVAAAFTIGIAIGPASALGAGLGGKSGGLGIGAGVSGGDLGVSAGVSVGGVGVSAGVSAGSQGASVGAGTSVGGIGVSAGVNAGPQGTSVGAGASVGSVGGANVGASVGAGSVGAGVSGNVGSTSGSVSTSSGVGSNASNNPSNTSGSVSAGIGAGADPSADNKSVAASPPAVTKAIVPAKTTRQSISLPPVLRPSRTGRGNSTLGYPFGSVGPLKMIPGTPAAVVQACRAAIMSAAKPLGAVRVRSVSAGALRQRRGELTAPIKVRIDYARKGGIEVRQAQVGCRLNTAGRVTAII